MEQLLLADIASVPLICNLMINGSDDDGNLSLSNSKQIGAYKKLPSEQSSINVTYNLWYWSIPIYVEQYIELYHQILNDDFASVQSLYPKPIRYEDFVDNNSIYEDVLESGFLEDFLSIDIYNRMKAIRDHMQTDENKKPKSLRYAKQLFKKSLFT